MFSSRSRVTAGKRRGITHSDIVGKNHNVYRSVASRGVLKERLKPWHKRPQSWVIVLSSMLPSVHFAAHINEHKLLRNYQQSYNKALPTFVLLIFVIYSFFWTMTHCWMLTFFTIMFSTFVFCFSFCTKNVLNHDPKTMVHIKPWILCTITCLVALQGNLTINLSTVYYVAFSFCHSLDAHLNQIKMQWVSWIKPMSVWLCIRTNTQLLWNIKTKHKVAYTVQ